ncbi:DUF1648 domain-containing protein [Clostridium sp. CS001]|uniref:DUF1648 domain-containing protein n=1 Tax=Clostridium sp. CS001 TaxID=2880648 RepID=UPI001CF380E9|nr:DUF1648 domain-containing protein [Clostridium sp. CS001]MCB2291357.1 DUF1648 domain-containing protein [Clostridium sp. CS001]
MKINRTGYDIFINVTCIVLLFGILIYLGQMWDTLPERIPGHYNAIGVVDRWGNKGELIIVPIIAWIMYIGLTVIEKYPQIWNTGVKVTEQNQELVYRLLKNMLGTVKLIIVSVFSFITINSTLSKGMPIWFLPVFLGLIFGSLIYFIIRLVKIK